MAGIVGAFLGSLLSAVCIILTGQLGYMASICGLAMLYFFALLGAVPMTLAGLRANSAADLFRMDADCAQVEDGYYMTQAGDVLYGVMIQTDCSEKDALDVLLAPIGDYRMDPDFDRFAFAFPGEQENLLTMTEEDGAAYRYNILSIYFTDGAVLHTAVALAEDGTLIRLESTHGPQVDDQEVLVHASRIQPGDVVVVHMGNVIPFDGEVCGGAAAAAPGRLPTAMHHPAGPDCPAVVPG